MASASCRDSLAADRCGRRNPGLCRLPIDTTFYLQERGHERTGHRHLFDRTLEWRNLPGWKAVTFDKPLTINSRGLRVREHTPTKPNGTYLDLDAIYVAEQTTVKQLMVGNHGYHWNAFGRALTARRLYNTLRDTGMLGR
ncbi:MAG: hypothetical protein QF363_11715 [Planctomycetaceae bacterium]|jgi:hypothetical protein|nr:hypothetical protein [Planctomycetaceae bacterium]